MKNRLFVIDGHALCYRAYYAFIRNPLINSQGQNTSAIYGFTRMLFKLIEEQKPEYLVVAFDPPGKTFRFDLYPEYKANRLKMPDDLRTQIDEIKNMLDIAGFARIEDPGNEADDVMGTIAAKYASKQLEIVLVTGDKDAYQLINDNVKIYSGKKGISEYEIYDAVSIKEKIGLEPEQVVDYMALMGDQSDNIPGVKGIGEKTSRKLIEKYNTLENLYENIEDFSGKQKEQLLSDIDMAYLSRELVTINTDVVIKLDTKEIIVPDINKEKVKDYFNLMEMNSIVRDFMENEDLDEKDIHTERDINYRIVYTEDDLKKLVHEVKEKGEMSIDTETTSLLHVEAELVGISISVKEKEGWYIPLKSKGLFSEEYLDRNVSLSILKPLIEDPGIKKIGHNIKYDISVLKNEGIVTRNIYFDTMVASYLLDPTLRRHNLDDLSEQHLNHKNISYKELVGTGKNKIPIDEVPLESLADYAVEDADVTYRLYKIFKPMLVEAELDSLFYDIEIPLVSILSTMEIVGVKIDKKHFHKMSIEYDKLIKKVQDDVFSEAGDTFNINSTKELSNILFNKLGLKSQKKTKTGLSTDISVLEALKGSHGIIEHLINYRTISKLKSTYIDALQNIVSEKTGRIHTSYNQTVAVTGRLSSSNPNLQNIPVRDEMGREIRRGFVPENGFYMLSADYSQIELRLAAHISGDENMIRAFNEGIDIHSLTAASVSDVDIDGVTPDMRRQAKIINFAIIYGVSPFGLAQQSDIGMKEAAWFIKIYFETYPGFKDYMNRTIEFAREHGYVKTLLGRKRMIPEINSSTTFRREGAERVAINTPIQGTSADMIKIAMINIQNDMYEKNLKSKMIMQVHDELVFEVHNDEKGQVEGLVRERMENAVPLTVPVVVDIITGKNWDEAH